MTFSDKLTRNFLFVLFRASPIEHNLLILISHHSSCEIKPLHLFTKFFLPPKTTDPPSVSSICFLRDFASYMELCLNHESRRSIPFIVPDSSVSFFCVRLGLSVIRLNMKRRHTEYCLMYSCMRFLDSSDTLYFNLTVIIY